MTMIILVVLGLAAVVFEVIGIGMFLPILEYARLEGDPSKLAAEGQFWAQFSVVAKLLDLPVSIVTMLVVALIAFLLRQLFLFVSHYYRAVVRYRFDKSVVDSLYSAYLKTSTEYQESFEVGDIINLITKEASRGALAIMSVLEIVVYLSLLAVYTTIMAALSYQMTIISVITLLLVSFVPKYWISKTRILAREFVGLNSIMNAYLVERIRSPRLIRLQGSEDREDSDFRDITKSRKQLGLRKVVLIQKTQLMIEPLVVALSILFIYLSIAYYHLPLETIGIYVIISLRLIPIVRSILGTWQSIQDKMASFDFIQKRMEVMNKNTESDFGKAIFSDLQTGICFRSVSYSYKDSSTEAVSDFSADIAKGSFVALVGPSGSGKSTIVDLLPRLREPRSGDIIVDGLPITDYSLATLRDGIVYIAQTPTIYSGSIREHLCYGSNDVTQEKLQWAAELAGLDGFVNDVELSYESKLVGDGQNLSGGQRQRLELARCLIRESSVMILDEPTSHLDAESEHKFSRTLENILGETSKTIILIALSLRNVVKADQIIVLRNGKVEATGTHNELAESSKWYKRAWSLQRA